jgi:hypothetical protein
MGAAMMAAAMQWRLKVGDQFSCSPVDEVT